MTREGLWDAEEGGAGVGPRFLSRHRGRPSVPSTQRNTKSRVGRNDGTAKGRCLKMTGMWGGPSSGCAEAGPPKP